MRELRQISYNELQSFESTQNANLTTSHNSIADRCPSNEARCYKVVLEKVDIYRIFLIQGSNFADFTENSSLKLMDLKKTVISQTFHTINEIESQQTISYLLDKNIDLSKNAEFAPVFISTNLDTGSLIAIDGNHRLMAHFLAHEDIQDVHAYLFVHSGTIMSGWFPPNTQ